MPAEFVLAGIVLLILAIGMAVVVAWALGALGDEESENDNE
jgi:high-affinity Fe2+/Pb2+ permease